MLDKSKKRRRHVSDQERNLEDLVFGKSVVVDGDSGKTKTKSSAEAICDSDRASHTQPSAWIDEDDEKLDIDLNNTSRLRKLRKSDSSVVSGSAFTTLLKERFQTREMAWASADTTTDTDVQEDSELASLLATSGGMLAGKKTSTLCSGRLDIKRLVDANAAGPSNKGINAVRFHPNGSLLLTAGEDKYLRFFSY